MKNWDILFKNHNFRRVNNNKIQELKPIEEKLSFATNIFSWKQHFLVGNIFLIVRISYKQYFDANEHIH
jgi:hypothetical protein